jgi:hypothetical protein
MIYLVEGVQLPDHPTLVGVPGSQLVQPGHQIVLDLRQGALHLADPLDVCRGGVLHVVGLGPGGCLAGRWHPATGDRRWHPHLGMDGAGGDQEGQEQAHFAA